MIERWPLARIRRYGRNARTHSEPQIRKIAESIREFGWTIPMLVTPTGELIAGHGRLAAAELLGAADVPVMIADGWTEAQIKAYRLADNRLALEAGWDEELLRLEFTDLKQMDLDLGLTGFSEFEISELLEPGAGRNHQQEPPPPDVGIVAVSRPGEIWLLGDHRLAVGDARDPELLGRLMAGDLARMVHADPPYGMGKERDGVLNDNLRNDALDAFQLEWWTACRPFLIDAASAYIWGNAEALWRLWHRAGGLATLEAMAIRNEIVWNKKSTPGMRSEDRTNFSNVTERCLFFQLGHHVMQVNRTQDDYWEGWEPLRLFLVSERDKAGFTAKDVRKICGNYMHGHSFGRSQWVFISSDNYAKLAEAAAGKAFVRDYDDLRAEYRRLNHSFHGEVLGPRGVEFRATRPYFDQTWEVMTDVWDFPRVSGEERFEHATPKPTQMAERAIRCASQEDEIVLEPFGGTGSTLIGAERCGRRCYTVELDPLYCDVILRRWQSMTGGLAQLEGGGTFAEVQDARSQT